MEYLTYKGTFVVLITAFGGVKKVQNIFLLQLSSKSAMESSPKWNDIELLNPDSHSSEKPIKLQRQNSNFWDISLLGRERCQIVIVTVETRMHLALNWRSWKQTKKIRQLSQTEKAKCWKIVYPLKQKLKSIYICFRFFTASYCKQADKHHSFFHNRLLLHILMMEEFVNDVRHWSFSCWDIRKIEIAAYTYIAAHDSSTQWLELTMTFSCPPQIPVKRLKVLCLDWFVDL